MTTGADITAAVWQPPSRTNAVQMCRLGRRAACASAFLAAALSIAGCDTIRLDGNTITQYPARCTVEMTNGVCPKAKAVALNPTTFTVLRDEQVVVADLIGSLTRYTNCAIVNTSSWKCSYNDSSGTFGFTNGNYWEDVNPSSVSKKYMDDSRRYFYVSKAEHERFLREFIYTP